jgi:zinc protease
MTRKSPRPLQPRSPSVGFDRIGAQVSVEPPYRTVTDATFGQDVLLSAKPVVVEFFAKRGRTCKTSSPALKELAAKWQDKVKIAKVDVDRSPLIRSDYEIYATPTLVLFKNGKPVARRSGSPLTKEELEHWINAELMVALASETSSVERRATEFTLSNGMQVVVIPDHRAPVITHMVCYKVGSADDPKGASGLARLLQNLMFKSTDKFANGEFSKIISRLGGQDSAVTGKDWTYFLQRISNDQLRTLMELEADRMLHLHLTCDEVLTERQLTIEERRSAIESNPFALLTEQVETTLYLSHPYAIPAIGWPRELTKLTRDDVMRFYKRYYVPDNALLVVSGDVTVEEVKRCSEETYGNNPASLQAVARLRRPSDPPRVAAYRVTLKDPRAGTALFRRSYIVPSYATARSGEAVALDLLARVLGGGLSSRLSRKLVFDDMSAASASCGYAGDALNSGSIGLYVVGSNGDPRAIETGVDAVVRGIRMHGVSDLELARAKRSLLAKYIFESDGQEEVTIRYGKALAVGRTIDQLERWPAEVAEVTVDDIKRVANDYLNTRRQVTGWLLPESDDDQDAIDPIP